MMKLFLLTVFTAALLKISLQHEKESDKERIGKLKEKIIKGKEKRIEEEKERVERMKHDHKHFNEQGEIDPSLLNPTNELDHIKSHLNMPNMDTDKMSREELQFHFFNMHDDDKNQKLDGAEIMKLIIHHHGERENVIFSDEELELLVDKLLTKIDFDLDGTVSWTEFTLVGGMVDLDE